MAAGNPSNPSSNIVDIVRGVVSTMNNLDSSTNTSTSINNVNNTNQTTRTSEEEVNDSFRLPRNQGSQPSRQPPRRSRNGRFAPYRNREKKANESKNPSHANYVMKDVCLLPSPDWDNVPRRDSKQQLVRQNMFIDAWTLDKTWSEEQLRNEILMLFKEQLKTVNE